MNKSPDFKYRFFLFIGVLCLLVGRLTDLSFVNADATFFWIVMFLDLAIEYTDKKKRILTGIVFVSVYFIRDIQTTGIFGLSFMYAAAGLALYGINLLYAYLIRRWNRIPVTLVYPVLWLIVYGAAFLLRAPIIVRQDMMFSDLAAMIQSVHLIGSAGLFFLIAWMAALMVYAYLNKRAAAGFLCAGVFLLLEINGILFLYPDKESPYSVRIAYTTGPYVGDFLNYRQASYEEETASLERSARASAAQGAGLLVFNEEAFNIDDTEEADFLSACSDAAAENHIYLLVGLDIADITGQYGGLSRNEAVLIDPEGEILSSYRKSRLIPVLEAGYLPGDGTIPSQQLRIGGRDVTISYCICYDSNFPRYIRGMSDDTDILLLPSWDWSPITSMHARMCRMLAAENRVSILKPTYDGTSIAVNAAGKVFHSSSTAEDGFETVHVVDMPIFREGEMISVYTEKSPAVLMLTAIEIFSILICLILLFAVEIENSRKTKRSRLFAILIFTNLLALAADAVSWLFDGCVGLQELLVFTTVVSMTMSLVMVMEFAFYLTEFIREKQELSHNIDRIICLVSAIIIGITLIGCFSGTVFSFDHGVYSDGPLYTAYVILNLAGILFGFALISHYRKFLGPHDSLAVYAYAGIPFISAIINVFVPEFSCAYPSITLSLLIVYIMLQSENYNKLQTEGIENSFNSLHDTLTGLSNRRAYEIKLEQLKDYEGSVGVIYADLNGLKYANDHLGHAAGDQLIGRFTILLCNIFRKEETYRIGGDEFIVLQPDINDTAFSQRLQYFREVLGKDEKPIACIGSAIGAGTEIEELIRKAEKQMYDEKKIFHHQHPELKR